MASNIPAELSRVLQYFRAGTPLETNCHFVFHIQGQTCIPHRVVWASIPISMCEMYIHLEERPHLPSC